MNKLKNPTLFIYGGSIYYFIEVFWKTIFSSGKVHWTMYLVGGFSFILIGLINEGILRRGMPLWKQQGISTFIILLIELISGLILNTWLALDIWHYEKYHILHQICLPYAFLWYWLSLLGICLDDKLREVIYGEEKHEYKWF